MYEVLALTMEIKNYPKEAVERVVLSLTDFGEVDYPSMLYSAAYLTRFGRKQAALSLYRQASRMMPERPEPYVLGLKLARDVGSPEDVEWAATGVLLNYWGTDFEKKQKEAEAALKDQIRAAENAGSDDLGTRLTTALTQAMSRDLIVRLEWNGAADLDLQVEEPIGSVCSFEFHETRGGGMFLHDGVGPDAGNSYELYICPRGSAGPYRILVRNAGGALVGKRATLTVTSLAGLPNQSRIVRTLVIEGEEVSLTIDLPQGRRTQPRVISELVGPRPDSLFEPQQALQPRPGMRFDPRREQVRQDFEQRMQNQQPSKRRAGAVGYAPVVQVIPEGTNLNAQAVISADRRYVRLGLQPVFNDITDVFTFTYLNGGAGSSAQSGAAGR